MHTKQGQPHILYQEKEIINFTMLNLRNLAVRFPLTWILIIQGHRQISNEAILRQD